MNERYRHKKTGGVYDVACEAKMQIADVKWDYVSVVVYRGEDGQHWVRPTLEFIERFEAVTEQTSDSNRPHPGNGAGSAEKI